MYRSYKVWQSAPDMTTTRAADTAHSLPHTRRDAANTESTSVNSPMLSNTVPDIRCIARADAVKSRPMTVKQLSAAVVVVVRLVVVVGLVVVVVGAVVVVVGWRVVVVVAVGWPQRSSQAA